ncbi:MAG: O-antigen ligase family protein [Candidatus Omnitrophica bacterium]|nr:O-antigen ligase family protein [Candidatus Omnitrophota bacterium]MDD5552624.1 O-antigen ligase family protein [Candidatus Omnitrophota bacterium]
MTKIVQRGLVLLVFAVPLVFSHSTTEVFGLIKWTLLEFGVLVLLVLLLLEAAGNAILRKGFSWSFNWAIAAFCAVSLISLLKAVNKYEGVMSLYQLGAGVGLFFVAANSIKERRQADEIILAMVLSGVAACMLSIYQVHGIKLGASRLAYTSSFGNPIFFAQYISLAIPLSVFMALEKERVKPYLRIFFAIAALFLLVFVILARSRGVYLGLSAAFIFAFISVYNKFPKKAKLALTMALVVFLSGSAIAVMSSRGERVRFRNLMRLYVWEGTFGMIKDNPVLGVGTGNFKVVYPLYRSAEERRVTPKLVTYTKAHNDFLQIWSETGTLGLICFLWILFSVYRRRPLQQGTAAYLSVGLSAAMIALLVQAFFNPLLYVPASSMGFWLLLALSTLRLAV